MTPRHRVLLGLLLLAGLSIRLVYASYGLEGRRFWDERYSLMNVQKILDTGSLRPAKGYYPSPLVSWPQAAAVAASSGLHQLTGWEGFAIRKGRHYSSTTYLLVRLFSVLYGTAAIAVLFQVGRLAASPGVGLVAATALAFMPLAIRQSGVFKPDALVLLTVLVATLWSMRAVLDPRARNHLLAAFGIALALSAKVTGGMVATAIVAGTLAMDWRDRRRWYLLALAAAASLIFFFAMNPLGADYLFYAAHLQDDYEMRAESKGMERWGVPRRVLALLAGGSVQGPWFGGVAAAGALLAVWLAARSRSRRRASLVTMCLAFPLLYVAAYTAVTPHFKVNNFLPIVPFVALAGAVALVGSWQWAGRRLPRLDQPAVTAPVALLLVAGLSWPGVRFVYQSLTPTTVDAATALLQDALGRRDPGRYVAVERWEAPQESWPWEPSRYYGRPGAATVVEMGDSGRLARKRLDRADGEVVRLEGGAGAAIAVERLGRVDPDAVTAFEGTIFRFRGPSVAAILHPWRPRRQLGSLPGVPCAERPDCVEIAIPRGGRLGARSVVSALIRVPATAGTAAPPRPTIFYRDRALRAWPGPAARGQIAFATERFRLGAGKRALRVEPVDLVDADLGSAFVTFWQPPTLATVVEP